MLGIKWHRHTSSTFLKYIDKSKKKNKAINHEILINFLKCVYLIIFIYYTTHSII